MTALPPGLPSSSLSQMVRWVREPIALLDECAARYGGTFTLRLLPFAPPYVVFSDPAAIKDIFTASPDELYAGEASAFLKSVVGDHSLLVLDGAPHLRERRLMMPSFHGDRMRAYAEAMRDAANHVIDRWPVGRPFPVQDETQAITLEVILRTVFGFEEGARLDRMRELLVRFGAQGSSPLGTMALLAMPPDLARRIQRWAVEPVAVGKLRLDVSRFVPLQAISRTLHAIDELLYAEIAGRRAASGPAREDVLSVLMQATDEEGRPMSDVQLRDEMLTLLIAGHETSATALAWAIHHVLANPRVLETIRAELARVVGEGPLRPEHLAELTYVDATLKETLRLIPIIGLVARVLKRPMRIGGHDLPAGVGIAACVHLAHHRPEAWPDPQRFEPERFLGRKIDPYEYLPFGGGVRRCLGMAFASYEMKIVLAEMLRRATLRAAPGSSVRVSRRGVIWAPSGGTPVVMDARLRAAPGTC